MTTLEPLLLPFESKPKLDFQSYGTSCSPNNILWDFRNSIKYVLPLEFLIRGSLISILIFLLIKLANMAPLWKILLLFGHQNFSHYFSLARLVVHLIISSGTLEIAQRMCCPRIPNKHLNFRINKTQNYGPSAANFLVLMVLKGFLNRSQIFSPV